MDMDKDPRTKPQLLDEVGMLRRRVAHLEGLERRAGTEGPEQLQAQDLETLFAVARDLAGLGGMEEKATKVLRRIADVMDAEWVALRLLDEEAQELRLVSFVGAGLDELPPLPVLRRGQLISGQALEQRRALVVNDYESHAGADPARIAQGMKSAASLVLTAGGRMVGTLQVNSSARDHFTEERVRFLTAIADGMGALLENARLMEAVRESEELYRTLFEQSRDAIYMTSDGRLVDVNEAALRMFGYTREEALKIDLDDLFADPADRHLRRERLARFGAVEDFETRLLRCDGTEFHCVITSWQRKAADGTPAGTAGIIRDISERKEAEEETRQLARENSVMAEIGRVIGSSLDVDAVYEHFAEHVRELMPFDRIDITLPGAEPGTVMHAYQSGVKAPGRMRGDVYPLAGTATEDVLKTGEEMLFHPRDVAEVDVRFPGLRPAFDSGLRSFMGIPLVTRNEVFGALFIASEGPDAYCTRDLSIAKRVGSQIAGAIANAQLYADRARAEQAQAGLAQRLNLLNELMRIAVSNLNVKEVFDAISEQIKKLIDHDRLSIDLLTTGESPSELYPFVAVGLGAVDKGLSMPLASPVGEVVRTGKPLLRDDLLRDGAYPIEAEFARTTGIRSAMVVPLTSRGRVIGCLTFSSAQASNYDERELDSAQTIADHLAVIVEHAQLYEETKRAEEQLRAINDVAVSTSSVLHLDDLLPYVTGLLHDTFGWDVVNVLLTDDKSENVVLRATLGHRDEAVAPGFKVDIGKQGIISWVAKTGEPLLANDVSQEPRYRLNEARPHIKAELAVAIKQGDDVLGVLDIESERLHAFDRTDVSTAQSLANQLAVAIENARLFELARDMAVLEERNRMAREIHDTMAQGFTGIVLQLEAAEQAFENTPSEIPDHLGRAKDLARSCLQEARRSVWNLLPRALEERPLSEALEKEVAQWASDGPEQANFTLSGVSRELDADIQAALLRICQESLANIRKHAGASQVSVQVTYLPSNVRLEIRDDGVGFDANAKSEDGMQRGFGLLGMEQRARLIRGELEVKTKQGHGTTISVEVPTG